MKRLTAFILMVMLAGLVACSNVDRNFVVDGSNAESTQLSIEIIQEGLSSRQREEFVLALLVLQLSSINTAVDILMKPELAEGVHYETLGPLIDGLTYDEILAKAETVDVKVAY